jgi:hypothetical protein
MRGAFLVSAAAKGKHFEQNALTPMNIHFLIGDSNCQGQGEPTSAYVNPYDHELNTKIYYRPTRTTTDNGSWQNLQIQVNNNIDLYKDIYFGSEIRIGYELGELRPFQDRIIKWGVPGSRFEDGTETWNKDLNDVYTEFKDYVFTPAITKLIAEGFTPVYKSLTLILGTNDAYTAPSGEGDNWYNNAYQFLNDLKTDLGLPSDLKVIIVQAPATAPNRPYITDVRTAQYNLVNGRNTGTILEAYPNSVLINTDSLAIKTDNTHWNYAGQLALGLQLFNIVKDL